MAFNKYFPNMMHRIVNYCRNIHGTTGMSVNPLRFEWIKHEKTYFAFL